MSRRSSAAPATRPARGRYVPLVSAGVAAVLVTAGLVGVTEQSAGAATKPLSQSVGRFLDGAVGNNPIQQLADVKDARAVNPGTTSAQNPLDATLLGQLELPLSGALQLPGGGVFKLGAANQVAVAKSDGYAYGASGAVSNSGGVSLGGNNKDFPAGATIELSDASLGSLKIPGLPSLPTNAVPNNAPLSVAPDASQPVLGGISATIGAVSALAQTKSGGDPVTPTYQIAGLNLSLKSPALSALLQQLLAGGQALQALIAPVVNALQGLQIVVPPACTKALTGQSLPDSLSLDHGAVVLDIKNAGIEIDLDKLLQTLHADLNHLPANTDLLAYVLNNLGDILSTGLESVINGIVDPIKALGTDCLAGLNGIPGIGNLIKQLFKALTSGQKKVEGAINAIAKELASGGAPGLKTLTDQLANVVSIGVNVESGPGKAADNAKYPYASDLQATPDQATGVVQGQTLVRAIEVDLLGGQVASLALGNAAAGPSTPSAAASSSPVPSTSAPVTGTAIPTGVPAGQGPTGGTTPVLPIALLVLGLLMAAGAGVTWRLRAGRHLG
jgi:hypothetical protein